MAKILLVEDDMSVATTVETWLSTEHHLTDIAYDGLEARERLMSFEYGLYILDWEVPEMTGIELCSLVRTRGVSSPILMLTGKGGIQDKTAGFEAGADDYLTKPFHPQELMARVKALLRRQPILLAPKLSAGDLEIDTKTREVFQSGKQISLQPMEYTLLEFLMQRPNEVFSADALLRRLWDSDSNVSSESLYVCLSRLRKKLEQNGTCPIATVRGAGYMLKVNQQ
ncbi:MAG: response regulator transcription factor [Candidatus Obscuribacterales bacterium]|nr:response regulator transcription factor [Candidatus Obscuribacterales bacterium]